MVELKVRLGPKGQVVIPKIFRNIFKLYPGGEVIITIERDRGVLIKRQDENIVEKLEKIAKSVKRKISQKEIDKLREEQYEERARKSGPRL